MTRAADRRDETKTLAVLLALLLLPPGIVAVRTGVEVATIRCDGTFSGAVVTFFRKRFVFGDVDGCGESQAARAAGRTAEIPSTDRSESGSVEATTSRPSP